MASALNLCLDIDKEYLEIRKLASGDSKWVKTEAREKNRETEKLEHEMVSEVGYGRAGQRGGQEG